MFHDRGQGALEYLLLIGGAVLVSTVILIIALNTAPQGNVILDSGINSYLQHVSLNGGGGGSSGTTDTNAPNVNFSVTRGNALVSITFSQNGSDASPPVTYTVIYSTNLSAISNFSADFSTATGIVSLVNSTTGMLNDVTTTGTFVQTGLTNGTLYYYRLEACDALNNCLQTTPALSATPRVPVISIALSGVTETVFDYTTDACSIVPNNWDFPDVYAHAVRNPQNPSEIVLVSGNSEDNYFSFGPDFDNLARICTPVLSATNKKHPDATAAQSFSNQEWVNMAYNDGTQVWGFVNNEFHDISPTGQSFGCSNSEYPGNPCWYNGITLARSNTGHNFVQTNSGLDVAIGPPLQWDPAAMVGFPYGTFEPSNIIFDGGFYYMLYRGILTPGSNTTGACLARATSISDATSWRAWDGSGYNLTVGSPYIIPGQQPCSFVGPGIWGSLTRNSYLESFGFGKYMAVGLKNSPVCGVYFTLSDDLIVWSTPQLIKAIDSPGCNGDLTNSGAYFSIIDHASTDQTNFSESGQSPHLYYTYFNANLDRDLVREQFTFTATP
jgi:hypothetical protein